CSSDLGPGLEQAQLDGGVAERIGRGHRQQPLAGLGLAAREEIYEREANSACGRVCCPAGNRARTGHVAVRQRRPDLADRIAATAAALGANRNDGKQDRGRQNDGACQSANHSLHHLTPDEAAPDAWSYVTSSEEHRRLVGGNLEPSPAVDARDQVVHPVHVVAQLLGEPAVATGWHAVLARVTHPLHLIVGAVAALGTRQRRGLHLGLLVEIIALVERHGWDRSTGGRLPAAGCRLRGRLQAGGYGRTATRAGYRRATGYRRPATGYRRLATGERLQPQPSAPL